MTNDAGHDPLDLADQGRTSTISEEEKRQQREKEQNDLRHVMSSKQGRRFVWRLLGEAGIHRSSFNTDPAMMAFIEGNRNFGIRLETEVLEACPLRYLEAQREHIEDKQRNAQRNAKP